jgi:hypothetical protein
MDLLSLEQIEFSKDFHILFKFFVIKNRLGKQIISSMRSVYKDITDEELVEKIKLSITEAAPEDYLSVLIYRTAENEKYWNHNITKWQLFYNIHACFSKIRKC